MLFKYHLIDHHQIAKEYEVLKRNLASAHEHDRTAYTEGKTEFVLKVTRQAKEFYAEIELLGDSWATAERLTQPLRLPVSSTLLRRRLRQSHNGDVDSLFVADDVEGVSRVERVDRLSSRELLAVNCFNYIP